VATIELGIGTSHSGMLSIGPEDWATHAELDRKNPSVPYDELLAANQDAMREHLLPEVWKGKHERNQAALERLQEVWREHAIDVVLVVGDDQRELFIEQIPSLAIYTGAEMYDLPSDLERLPPSLKKANWGWHGTEPESYPVAPAFATHLVTSLMGAGFDVAQINAQPAGRSIGHAFTFIRRRIMRERCVPMVPVFVNTYFPPNQPTAARCVALGQALRRAVTEWPHDLKVCVVGSGGLSHFLVDEPFDRRVLDALMTNDLEELAGIEQAELTSGTSEVRNWIVVAAALTDEYTPHLVDYIPIYRSLAGTGIGTAFMVWTKGAATGSA